MEGEPVEDPTLEAELAEGMALEDVEQLEAQLGAPEDEEEVEPVDEEELAAAAALDAATDNADDAAAEDGVEVLEHLKDAVEGSLRLKRLLSRDDEESQAKKRKLDPAEEEKQKKIRTILLKWAMTNDSVVRHVLESCDSEDIDEIAKSGYVPDKYNQYKSAAELFAKYACELKERKMPGGSANDVVAAFKFKHKLDFSKDKLLRALSSKDLRYVLSKFDGSTSLEDCIAEAKLQEAEDDNSTVSALPVANGVSTMSRFNRLELIDPLADAAVFGDANLTFSLKLARHRKAMGHVGRVVATTFEEIDTLRERYKEIDESIKTLEEHFAEVYHGVDCTRIAIDTRFHGMEGTLGAVYYNFPHSGAIQGFFDGHPMVNWRHENLMRLFFRALRSYVKPGGQVKVASNMGAVGVRYSYIVGSALENEFVHTETMPFMDWHLHRYGRSYGDKRDIYKRPDATNNQSYNAQAAERDMVYCFSYAPTGKTLDKQTVRLPPTLTTLKSCTDGPFRNLAGVSRENLAKQLHKRFITEVSGTHVG